MSRPTSKKESKELLKFFNSIKNEDEKEFDSELEIVAIVFNIYLISIIYILYNVFFVFF